MRAVRVIAGRGMRERQRRDEGMGKGARVRGEREESVAESGRERERACAGAQ